MSLRSLGLWAAALFWLALAQPVAAQTLTSFPLRGADSATYNNCAYSDGSHIFPCHLMFGWTGSAAKAWTVDASGYGGVNVFSSALPTGAATSAKQDALVAALGTPLQAGGAVGLTGTLPAFAAAPTVNLGTLGGAATSAKQDSLLAALGTPLQAGGSVAVSNLPSTQAVSAAALPLPAGAATSAKQDSLLAAVGSPLQAGGNVVVTSSALPSGASTSANQSTANASLASIATNTASSATAAAQSTANASLATIATNSTPPGVGAMAAVPTATTNGTALGTLPAGAKGARFYLGSADTVTFTVATSAPGSAPANNFTISGASSGTGPNWDENLSGSAMIYVTATTGSPKFRWY